MMVTLWRHAMPPIVVLATPVLNFVMIFQKDNAAQKQMKPAE
jgi:hypothetical protein